MMSDDIDPGLESAILAVYRGPLEAFISGRDALVKQLRASKRREAADRVKALRKPSRTAWVLNHVVYEDAAPVEQLASAINAAQTASSGTDVRTALENVRAAVRAVATAGARAGIRGGQPIEANALMSAVHAVIGDANAFAELRAGRLTEIPEGGGLDILTAITSARPLTPLAATTPAAPTNAARPETRDADEAVAARADLRRVEATLAKVREQLKDAERSVLNAQAKLDAAEQKLQHAQAEASARRTELERARQDTRTAATQVADAERAVSDVRARIK